LAPELPLEGKTAIQFIDSSCAAPPGINSNRETGKGNAGDYCHDRQTDEHLE
jgi:hypothetical protein